MKFPKTTMSVPRWFLVLIACSGLVGLAWGYWGGPRQDRLVVPAPESQLSPSDGKQIVRSPVLTTPNTGLAARRFADLRKTGTNTELKALLGEVLRDQTIPPVLREIYVSDLVRRLAEHGDLDQVPGLDGMPRGDRGKLIPLVVGALVEIDPQTAANLVLALPAGGDRAMATEALMRRLGETAPEIGLALLDRPGSNQNPDQLSPFYFFSHWTKKHPQAAAAAALKFRPNQGLSALRGVIITWAREDPEAAWAYFESQPPENRDRLASSYLNGLFSKDPVVALRKALIEPELQLQTNWREFGRQLAGVSADVDAVLENFPPGEMRTGLIAGIAATKASDPAAAVAWTATLLPGERDAAVDGIFEQLGTTDPETGFQLAASELAGPARERALRGTVDSWGKLDFDAAFAAVASLDVPTTQALVPILYGGPDFFFAANPAERVARLADLDPAVRPEMLRAVGEQLGRARLDYAATFLSGLVGEDRENFAEGLISEAFRNADTVIALAEILPTEKRAHLVGQISRAIATESPADAAKFIATLPDRDVDNQKRDALRTVVGDWTYADPEAADRFLRGLPPGETKDAAVAVSIGRLRTFDLDSASRLLGEVADADARSRLVGELARDWRRIDPARGRAVLLPLLRTPEERRRVEEAWDR